MPNSATVKTKWAPKHYWWLVGAVLFVAMGWWLLRPSAYTMQVGSKRYTAEVVNSKQALKRGLSGREDMADDHGMLFVFPQAARPCIWMKDMRFSLDVVWLDDQKRVVDIQEHMTPGTYPRSFCPAEPARYVIELNAGQIQANGVRPGQKASF